MKRDLGYRSVKAWPIYQRDGGAGIVMYYMIHATDHPEGPKLMWRAYRNAVQPLEQAEQLTLELQHDAEMHVATLDDNQMATIALRSPAISSIRRLD